MKRKFAKKANRAVEPLHHTFTGQASIVAGAGARYEVIPYTQFSGILDTLLGDRNKQLTITRATMEVVIDTSQVTKSFLFACVHEPDNPVIAFGINDGTNPSWHEKIRLALTDPSDREYNPKFKPLGISRYATSTLHLNRGAWDLTPLLSKWVRESQNSVKAMGSDVSFGVVVNQTSAVAWTGNVHFAVTVEFKYTDRQFTTF